MIKTNQTNPKLTLKETLINAEYIDSQIWIEFQCKIENIHTELSIIMPILDTPSVVISWIIQLTTLSLLSRWNFLLHLVVIQHASTEYKLNLSSYDSVVLRRNKIPGIRPRGPAIRLCCPEHLLNYFANSFNFTAYFKLILKPMRSLENRNVP